MPRSSCKQSSSLLQQGQEKKICSYSKSFVEGKTRKGVLTSVMQEKKDLQKGEDVKEHCCCKVVSDSVRPHRRQPTRLLHPWNSPGKNTGVGCHFLLQCMKVKSESEVARSCPTFCDPMDYQAPLSTGVSRQEYWSGVPLPSPKGILRRRKTIKKKNALDSTLSRTDQSKAY